MLYDDKQEYHFTRLRDPGGAVLLQNEALFNYFIHCLHRSRYVINAECIQVINGCILFEIFFPVSFGTPLGKVNQRFILYSTFV